MVMITFGDLDKLPYPDIFSKAISNCERVLECVTIITPVGLNNNINERHLTSMESCCLFSMRKTTYYEAKATWLSREENLEENRVNTSPPGESSLTATPNVQTYVTTDQTRTGAIGSMTKKIDSRQIHRIEKTSNSSFNI